MKNLPSIIELKDAFSDFAMFTFELLEIVESKPNYLKFAAVNSQIALELFLKYLYVKQGKIHEIQKKKKGALENDFVDFSQILNYFYSSRRWSYGVKEELIKLLETRNAIVHRGQNTEWDKDLAKSVVRTLYFIHATAWSEIGEILLFENDKPHRISNNAVWREGVQSVVKDFSDVFHFEARTCLTCYAKSVVTGDIMALGERHTEEHLICLNCLTAINTSHEVRQIECYFCHKKTYLIDVFNEQDGQLYVAACSECRADTWVRRCKNCEEFYHPLSSDEVKVNGFYFCSDICSNVFRDVSR